MELFTCKMCKFEEEYEDAPAKCPECGLTFYRITFLKEPGAKSKSRWGANHPRWSWSLGINRQDIPTMKKKHPDRTYHSITGQLLIENRKHKKQMMKEHGAYELC